MGHGLSEGGRLTMLTSAAHDARRGGGGEGGVIGQLAAAASIISFVPAHMAELARNGPQAVCIGMRTLRLHFAHIPRLTSGVADEQ